ncbi:hypothetical protein [Pandoraea oxalativorans]|uniref:Uncharacterized protein n=1 Tax=Pandoraea oxalativorans TaxID=573737 RepID=A0A0E3YAJ0_9BURK|nr:hypothetical protein [Pandoraea oxalativorans]AKC68932.1 hypothetical protein MB84_04835 [Pandoraea oxalativorans]
MQHTLRALPHGTQRTDGSPLHSPLPGMPQRRLNELLDVISRRFGLHGLQAQAFPGAGITLENGDALYFRANESVETFDVYFRVDIPPAMLGQPHPIQLISENCFSDITRPPMISIEATEGILLLGFSGIDYEDIHKDAEGTIDSLFSEYRKLVQFLRNEVY